MTVTGIKRTKLAKETVTKPATKTTASKTAKLRALDRCIPYAEKVRLMVIEVLREESGRELAAEARFDGQEFDWQEHNEQFRADYKETSMKELMRAARKLYGLDDLDVIRERRKAHREKRNERVQNTIASGTANELDDYDMDEIDMDEENENEED